MTWKLPALLVLICLTASAQARVPVIIDTDIGDSIDDALALAFALHSPELDVRAVTTVIDDVESKTRLAWKMLGIYNRRDIALAMGAPEPLLDPTMSMASKEFDVLTRNDVVPDAARRRAADLMIDTLLQARGKTTIVAIGPLTNIALAIKSDPRIKNRIERIVMMGGAYLSSEAEYNVKRDRAAADIVFHSGVPITAVGSGCDLAVQAARERSGPYACGDGSRLDLPDPAGRPGRTTDPRRNSHAVRSPGHRRGLPAGSSHHAGGRGRRPALGRGTDGVQAGCGIQDSGGGPGECSGFPGPVRGPRDQWIGRAAINGLCMVHN